MSAAGIFHWSVAGAAIMLLAFAILVMRRRYQERRRVSDRQELAFITRSYMRRVAGQSDAEFGQSWRDELKLAAVSHIHLLLRGGERERLMELVELDGLLRAMLHQARSIWPARRIDAIRLLQQFGSEACIAALREMFVRDRNEQVRMEAAFALAASRSLPPPRETIRILGILARRVHRLDRALFRSSAPQYPEQLKLLLADEMSNEHRALIIDALGCSRDATVLPLLEDFSRSEEPELRSAALQAAAQLGYPAVEAWVLQRLSDPVGFVRIQAVNCCAALRLRNAAPALQPLLHDEELWVRLRTEHALGVLEEEWVQTGYKGQRA